MKEVVNGGGQRSRERGGKGGREKGKEGLKNRDGEICRESVKNRGSERGRERQKERAVCTRYRKRARARVASLSAFRSLEWRYVARSRILTLRKNTQRGRGRKKERE